jgi:hypothetical protein
MHFDIDETSSQWLNFKICFISKWLLGDGFAVEFRGHHTYLQFCGHHTYLRRFLPRGFGPGFWRVSVKPRLSSRACTNDSGPSGRLPAGSLVAPQDVDVLIFLEKIITPFNHNIFWLT